MAKDDNTTKPPSVRRVKPPKGTVEIVSIPKRRDKNPIPIEEWIPHPVFDSSEYLRRRGPWPRWTPPAD